MEALLFATPVNILWLCENRVCTVVEPHRESVHYGDPF